MSGSSARTGELGQVRVDGDLIARITEWTLNETVSESAWGDSDSGAFTVRKRARKDCSGTIGGKFDSEDKVYSIFRAGDIVALILSETPADTWRFPSVLIQNFKITYNVDSKEVVGWTADWATDGEYSAPGE